MTVTAIYMLRNNKENFKLVLSCSASNPRVYLASDYKKENPINAPMFCMLFRKYIQGGNIVKIAQVGFERIIKITVESLDELFEDEPEEFTNKKQTELPPILPNAPEQSSKENDDMDVDIQKELEAKFDELFGPIE